MRELGPGLNPNPILHPLNWDRQKVKTAQFDNGGTPGEARHVKREHRFIEHNSRTLLVLSMELRALADRVQRWVIFRQELLVIAQCLSTGVRVPGTNVRLQAVGKESCSQGRDSNKTMGPDQKLTSEK